MEASSPNRKPTLKPNCNEREAPVVPPVGRRCDEHPFYLDLHEHVELLLRRVVVLVAHAQHDGRQDLQGLLRGVVKANLVHGIPDSGDPVLQAGSMLLP